jgi:molecular chaperone DnaJ
VDDGAAIRLSGQGETAGAGGVAGDLYVEMRIKRHAIFHREGAHLVCELPLSFATAALGGEVEIPTLEGEGRLKIPAGTQSGKRMRVRGKGLSLPGGARGDLFCLVRVETPVNLSEEQKRLIIDLDARLRADGKRHKPVEHEGWAGKVKNFFEQLAG